MTKEEKIIAASYAMYKGYDYERMYYSDHMYGNEEYMEDVWEYVEEYTDYGAIAFKQKYSEYDLY